MALKESAILRQLEQYQQAAQISAEWNDLVSVEEIAAKTSKTIQHVKAMLTEKGVAHKGKLGKSYLYSKAELLKVIKQSV